MEVLITGGAGFLGSALAQRLLARGELCGQPITRITSADLYEPRPTLLQDARVSAIAGDLLTLIQQGKLPEADVVFHLAAAVSAECEADFDLGMRSNLETTRALLETLRTWGNTPRLIFASSVAVFGSETGVPMPDTIRDNTMPVPQSSYGIQKFVCEQLVADYTRKGFIDGRNLRLMTVSVRPGRPNGAASGFLSGMLREPLHGEESVCPVPLETEVAIASPARTIDGIIAGAEATREQLQGRTAINLPALTVTVAQMLDTLEAVGGAEARALVKHVPDARIAAIVGSWPARFQSDRATALGLASDPDFRSVVEQFLASEAR